MSKGEMVESAASQGFSFPVAAGIFAAFILWSILAYAAGRYDEASDPSPDRQVK